MKRGLAALWAGVLMIVVGTQTVHSQDDNTEAELKKYREMISDPFSNPGFLYVDRGQELWTTPRGPKNISLETCDLGQGPGKLEGAYAGLPRFFADVGKVMDLEMRILWCLETIQGIDTTDMRKKPFSPSNSGRINDQEALVAYVANQSNGTKFNAPMSHPKEKEMYALGEALFHRRSAQFDFSCQTCHSQAGSRIRLQALPTFDTPADAQATMGSWPTYRVSQAQLRTMQHRLWDCYWQMRMPDVGYGSDAVLALTTYLTAKAAGGTIEVPSIKR